MHDATIVRETPTSTVVEVRRPTAGYLDQFVRLTCAPDLLALRLFPNAKEITESMAAWRACAQFGAPVLNDPRASAVVVGDGRTPRTGALLAFRSKWRVTSVDPLLDAGAWGAIQRLTTISVLIEDVSPPLEFEGPVVLVAVHSHAKLATAFQAIRAPRIDVVAIPCCVEQSLPWAPTHEYDDWRIWSPKRHVIVWRDLPPVS